MIGKISSLLSQVRAQSDRISDTEEAQETASTSSPSQEGEVLPDEETAVDKSSNGYRLVMKAVRAELRQGRPTYALRILAKDPLALRLKDAEFDRIKAQIAQSYLMEGKIERASEVAAQAVRRSGQDVPLAGWVAGQAAWRKGDFGKAVDMFAVTAESRKSSAWLAAAGAYWAARSSYRAGNFEDVRDWQEKAARFPRTFYGMVALKALGRDYDFNWDAPSIGFLEKKNIEKSGQVAAAIRTVHQGDVSSAINMLARSGWLSSREKREQLLAYMIDKNVPSLVLYLGRRTRDADGRFYDVALYPESPWEPNSGYQVDKAIVHALIRQESRFDPHASSNAGAKGLMQLLPSTARFVLRGEEVALHDPESNIDVGQRYVRQLMKDPSVKNNLFRMAIAYNAGPGNLARWEKQLKDVRHDPLLFIESIPSAETRAFVERVMVNYWIYRARMGQDAPSLEEAATFDTPHDTLRMAAASGLQTVAVLAGQ